MFAALTLKSSPRVFQLGSLLVSIVFSLLYPTLEYHLQPLFPLLGQAQKNGHLRAQNADFGYAPVKSSNARVRNVKITAGSFSAYLASSTQKAEARTLVTFASYGMDQLSDASASSLKSDRDLPATFINDTDATSTPKPILLIPFRAYPTPSATWPPVKNSQPPPGGNGGRRGGNSNDDYGYGRPSWVPIVKLGGRKVDEEDEGGDPDDPDDDPNSEAGMPLNKDLVVAYFHWVIFFMVLSSLLMPTFRFIRCWILRTVRLFESSNLPSTANRLSNNDKDKVEVPALSPSGLSVTEEPVSSSINLKPGLSSILTKSILSSNTCLNLDYVHTSTVLPTLPSVPITNSNSTLSPGPTLPVYTPSIHAYTPASYSSSIQVSSPSALSFEVAVKAPTYTSTAAWRHILGLLTGSLLGAFGTLAFLVLRVVFRERVVAVDTEQDVVVKNKNKNGQAAGALEQEDENIVAIKEEIKSLDMVEDEETLVAGIEEVSAQDEDDVFVRVAGIKKSEIAVLGVEERNVAVIAGFMEQVFAAVTLKEEEKTTCASAAMEDIAAAAADVMNEEKAKTCAISVVLESTARAVTKTKELVKVEELSPTPAEGLVLEVAVESVQQDHPILNEPEDRMKAETNEADEQMTTQASTAELAKHEDEDSKVVVTGDEEQEAPEVVLEDRCTAPEPEARIVANDVSSTDEQAKIAEYAEEFNLLEGFEVMIPVASVVHSTIEVDHSLQRASSPVSFDEWASMFNDKEAGDKNVKCFTLEGEGTARVLEGSEHPQVEVSEGGLLDVREGSVFVVGKEISLELDEDAHVQLGKDDSLEVGACVLLELIETALLGVGEAAPLEASEGAQVDASADDLLAGGIGASDMDAERVLAQVEAKSNNDEESVIFDYGATNSYNAFAKQVHQALQSSPFSSSTLPKTSPLELSSPESDTPASKSVLSKCQKKRLRLKKCRERWKAALAEEVEKQATDDSTVSAAATSSIAHSPSAATVSSKPSAPAPPAVPPLTAPACVTSQTASRPPQIVLHSPHTHQHPFTTTQHPNSTPQQRYDIRPGQACNTLQAANTTRRPFSGAHRPYQTPQPPLAVPQCLNHTPQRTYAAPHYSHASPQHPYTDPARSFGTPRGSYPTPSDAYTHPRIHQTPYRQAPQTPVAFTAPAPPGPRSSYSPVRSPFTPVRASGSCKIPNSAPPRLPDRVRRGVTN
ncbi:hypothetical protein BDQ12DRAFT_739087 [Crucibulum laeve]|uniref:Uncharacterized protein n=1 Tax=Crucibulum laeve TaxID=68775 RepID=A0A5C3LJN8_9AGAR|nr:hypothetical protein BDQ12DRAFT_739087 [Crucibulum laeve]